MALPLLLIAGGSFLVSAAFAQDRVAGRAVPQPDLPRVIVGSTIPVTLTGYWPYAAKTEAERRMEGPPVDASGYGRPIHTLQQHMADPIAHPFVSASGDLRSAKNPGGFWAYGQRVIIPALGTPSLAWQRRAGQSQYVVRVVDTGSHFYGPIYDATDGRPVPRFGKNNPHEVIRRAGYKPLDIAVKDRAHTYNALAASAILVPGDVLDPRTGRPARALVS